MGLLHLSISPGNSKSWKTKNNKCRITKFFMIMYTEKDPKDPGPSKECQIDGKGFHFSNPLNFQTPPVGRCYGSVYLFDHFLYVSFLTHGGLQL